MKRKPTKHTNYKLKASKTNRYYDHIAHSIYTILSNNPTYSTLKSCVVQDKNSGAYLIKNFHNCSEKENKEHLLVLQDFESDLKEYLLYDKPFKILFQDEQELYNDILERLSKKLYEYSGQEEVSDDEFDPFEHTYFRPTIVEFKKVIKCFEPIIFSFYPIMKSLPDLDYAKTIMELHNKEAFENKNQEQLQNILEYDSLSIESLMPDNEPEIKIGIDTYLHNKNSILKNINNKHFEKLLWSNIKTNFSEDYWVELANKFPNLKNKSKDLESVVNLSSAPIYCIDIDVQSVLDASLHILDYKELSTVMNQINESVILYKPSSIDFINTVSVNEQIKIIMSGNGLDENLAIKIGNLFEQMIHEYNSDNVSKNLNSYKKNKKYLDKAAETLWLGLELGNKSLVDSKKKPKI